MATKFYPVPFGHVEVRVDRRPAKRGASHGDGDEARDLRHTRPARADVRVPSGDVDLETVEGTETVVELSASPELEEEARIELHPKRDGHEVSVVIEKRSGLFRSFRDDIRLRITAAARSAIVDLSTASADVDARGDFGAAKVNTASGDVSFEHVGGEAQVNSASGDVNISQVDGPLTVNTASGDVEIGRLEGEGKVRAASGDI